MVIFATTTWLALRAAQVERRILRIALALIPLATMVAIILVLVGNDETATIVSKMLTILLVVVAPVAILKRLVAHPVISLNTFYGAVCVYLLIAMFFATTYGLIALISGQQFFVAADGGPQGHAGDRLPLLQLRDHHDHRLRRPHRRLGHRAHDGRARGHLRTALPDHRRGAGRPEPGPAQPHGPQDGGAAEEQRRAESERPATPPGDDDPDGRPSPADSRPRAAQTGPASLPAGPHPGRDPDANACSVHDRRDT